MTHSLHMQDWVLEHWDKMPRYGEGNSLATAQLCWIQFCHSWLFASPVAKSACRVCLPDWNQNCLQSSFSMGMAQGAGMAAVRCVLPAVCKV